ncbi:MAG: hypothetical protein NVS2B3_18200 [Vulcanimicrobiaceae bacterium]
MSATPMTPRGRRLERADASDVASIVALETHPSMTPYLGSWTAERHARSLADPDYRYYVVRDGARALEGFAIVAAYNANFRWYEIARLAVREPGGGRGADFLHGVLMRRSPVEVRIASNSIATKITCARARSPRRRAWERWVECGRP